MTLKEALGTDKVGVQNSKNGAGENQWHVRLGDIRVLAKKIEKNHELAMAFWQTKNIDATLLAILVIKLKALSAVEMDRLVRIRLLLAGGGLAERLLMPCSDRLGSTA